MTELEQLLNKARQLAESRNHKLLPFVRRGRSTGSRCVTCARQVYVMPEPPLNSAIAIYLPNARPRVALENFLGSCRMANG